LVVLILFSSVSLSDWDFFSRRKTTFCRVYMFKLLLPQAERSPPATERKNISQTSTVSQDEYLYYGPVRTLVIQILLGRIKNPCWKKFLI
jgi:hypothetical protein